MSIEMVVDESGVGMKLKRTSKNRYIGISFDTDAVENMNKFKLRSDDVLICSYSKCGIHWVWENVRMLLTGEISSDDLEKEESMMEYQTHLESMASPRILNNHCFFDEQPSDLLTGNTKLIFLYRNPKDVAVSFHQHHLHFPALEYNGDFQNFLQRFAKGQVLNSSYFEYLLSFEDGLKKFGDTIPFLLVRYEDLQREPVAERRRIAEFLGKTSYDDDFLKGVYKATDIEVMKKNKTSTTHRKNPDTRSVMYRKGKVGGWVDTFTAEQNQWFDDVVNDVMARSDMFKFVYSID